MRQRHGQNFLTDNNIANNIIKASNLERCDTVLEIGPGKGILTKIIQPQVHHLTAIEIDVNLFLQLNHYFTFHNAENITLINEDFLKYNMKALIEPLENNASEKEKTTFKIISNLPYNMGTAIIQKILPLKTWSTAVFMLQKEVIERLASKPGSKDYGYISIFTSYYADCTVLFDVSPKCFNPPPKVVSSVIKLTNRLPDVPAPMFFDFVKYAFSMRRKTILNCISSFKDLEKINATLIIDNLQLDPFLRPDKLSISDFLSLTKELKKYTICRVGR
jgi:16S rRNA (adenine1518-N6/adenine1519-N6)-dimethyltransferase